MTSGEETLNALRQCADNVELETLTALIEPPCPLRSGIFNRLKLLALNVVPDDEIKISLADLNMIQLHLEQFIIYELYAHLPSGCGLPILDRLKRHKASIVKVELETIRLSHYTDDQQHRYAGELLENCQLLLEIAKNGLFAGYVRRYQVDLLTVSIHLGFGKTKSGTMFARPDQGLAGRRILTSLMDRTSDLGSVIADLIQLRSVPNAPGWMVAATGTIMGVAVTRPNAILAIVNGVLLSDRVKLRHQVAVQLGRLVARDKSGQPLVPPRKVHFDEEVKQVIMSEQMGRNEHVCQFVASILISVPLSHFNDILSNAELTYTAYGVCFRDLKGLEDLPEFDQLQRHFDATMETTIDVYAALIDNNITPVKQHVKNFLAGQMTRQLTCDKFDLIASIANKTTISTSFDLTAQEPEEIGSDEKIKIITELLKAADKSIRIKVFYWSLRQLYRPQSPLFIHNLLATLLSWEPDVLGLDFSDDEVLSELINILSLLLEQVTDDDTIQLILAIIALAISDLANMEQSSRKLIKEGLIKPIEMVKNGTSSKKVKRTATDLLHVILTGGAVKFEDEKGDDEEVNEIDELTSKMTISDWANHLTDSLLPIRAGALRELTKSVKRGEKLEVNVARKFKAAAQQAVQSKESFLFLSGIEALATLALDDAELMGQVIDRLKSKNGNVALQSAEIVARICPRLGDLGCHYAQQLVPIILQLAQRETSDSLIIASALSAGADLLPLLGFYIHDIQHELTQAITSFLQPVNDLPVRLASCVLAQHLFERSESGSIFTTLDASLAQLYRAFKLVRDNCLEDESLRNQAALAIERLDAQVRSHFAPSSKLEKKITILG